VIENGTIRSVMYDFLLVCYCKYIVQFWSYLTLKNVSHFFTHPFYVTTGKTVTNVFAPFLPRDAYA